jgi:hypothetical protein
MTAMRRLAVLALTVAALTSGCTTAGQDVPPTEGPETTRPPQDAGLRPVSLPYGDGLPYLAPETSAQAICQALPAERWQELLGGPVGRTIDDRLTCVVTGADVTVKLRMRELAPDPDAEVVTIAGHQVRIGDQQAATALLPVGEQDLDAQVLSRTLPVFHVEGPDEKLRELVAALLPVLVHDGPPVPAPDADGEVPFTPTPPVPGVRLGDLPAPVQGLVLCTAIQAATGTAVEQVHVNRGGGCEVGDTTAVVLADYAMGDATQTIAGLPATVDVDMVYVALSDHAVLRLKADLAFIEQLIGTLGEL